MQRFFQGRIQREVPGTDLLVDNGPQFPRPRILGKRALLVTDFRGQAQANRQSPGFGNSHPRPDVIPHPIPTMTRLNAREYVKTSFKPWGKAVSDLERLMK